MTNLRFLPKLSYANVMATIAVFVALGGASYAAVKIPSRSVGTTQLKLKSVGQPQLKLGAVGTPQLRSASVGAQQLAANAVGPDSLQGNAVGSDQLAPNSVGERELKPGGVTEQDLSRDAAVPRIFAHVSSSGSLAEGAHATRANRISKGQYSVDFDRSLRGCVAVAGVGFGFGPGVIGAGGTAQARMNLDNQSDRVGITVYRKGWTFNDIEDADVSVIVAC
jgi:hypothetical protein